MASTAVAARASRSVFFVKLCAAIANGRAARHKVIWQHAPVQDALMTALSARRPQVHARWEDLLRAEKVTTPLANPDALVHLIDWTLDEVFRTLQGLPTRRRPLRVLNRNDIDCPCGRNPLLIYFAAGEQALQESLVLSQSENLHLDPTERDSALHELNLALRHIARREIGAFCSLCQLRDHACAGDRSVAHAAQGLPQQPV